MGRVAAGFSGKYVISIRRRRNKEQGGEGPDKLKRASSMVRSIQPICNRWGGEILVRLGDNVRKEGLRKAFLGGDRWERGYSIVARTAGTT